MEGEVKAGNVWKDESLRNDKHHAGACLRVPVYENEIQPALQVENVARFSWISILCQYRVSAV